RLRCRPQIGSCSVAETQQYQDKTRSQFVSFLACSALVQKPRADLLSDSSRQSGITADEPWLQRSARNKRPTGGYCWRRQICGTHVHPRHTVECGQEQVASHSNRSTTQPTRPSSCRCCHSPLAPLRRQVWTFL